MAPEVPFSSPAFDFLLIYLKDPHKGNVIKNHLLKKKNKPLVFTGFIESRTWLWSIYTALTVDSD